MDNAWQELKNKSGERIIWDKPFSSLTTLKIGGPIKALFIAETEAELLEIIQFANTNQLTFIVIGGGSNLLVSDQGYPGLVIQNKLFGITQNEHSSSTNGTELTVKSGTTLQELVNFSIQHALGGLQKLTGIPGTVGGAIYGNAGAYGQTISDNLVEIKALNPVILGNTSTMLSVDSVTTESSSLNDSGQAGMTVIQLSKEDCGFSYRDSNFKENGFIILEATFKLDKGEPKKLQDEADEILIKRLQKYPKGIKCPGSFFKNLVAEKLDPFLQNQLKDKIVYGKIPAGTLLEEVGAKGAKLDQIQIAPYHANLFINLGNGSASDFYLLAKKYYKLVKEKFGIELTPEVQLINLPPFR